MSRFTDPLELGKEYDRKVLANHWGLRGYQAIGRGVFTPRGSGKIFLFVTRDRESWMTLYNNFLDGDLLFWEGEKGHGSDERIANVVERGEEIHVFYRDKRLKPFRYCGKASVVRCAMNAGCPSEFVFQLLEVAPDRELEKTTKLEEAPGGFAVLSDAGKNGIGRLVAAKSRGIAQRVFRGNLLRLWQGSCAVTNVEEPRVLRSSHIKPWTVSNVEEKVDHFNGLLLVANLDALFNEGLISFRNDGRILISNRFRADDQARMHITADLNLRTVHPKSSRYLQFHRDTTFEQVS